MVTENLYTPRNSHPNLTWALNSQNNWKPMWWHAGTLNHEPPNCHGKWQAMLYWKFSWVNQNGKPVVLCGAAWPKRLAACHRLSFKTLWDGMSHAGRKPSTWQDFSPLSHIPTWQLLETLTRVYTACPFGSHRRGSTGHSLSFAICSDSLLLWCPLSSLRSQYWAECNDEGNNTYLQIETYTDKHKENGEEWERHTERCILDLSKALQDVRKPVFGQEENGKQTLHQTLKMQATDSSPGERAEQRRSQPKWKLLREAKCVWPAQTKNYLQYTKN